MLLDFKRLISLSVIALFAIQLSASNSSLISQSADTLAAYKYYQRADSLYAISQFEQALENFTQAINEYQQANAHEGLAKCYYYVGLTYLRIAEFGKAQTYAEKILNECIPEIDSAGIHKVKAYKLLGVVATENQDPKEAENFYSKASKELDKLGENQIPMKIEIYEVQGRNFYMLGKIDKSLEVIQKSLKLAEEYYGKFDIHVANANNNLGNICYGKNDFLRAKSYFDKALEIKRKIHGDDHRSLISTYANLASVELNLGNDDKGISYNDNALRLIIKNYGVRHPYVAFIYRSQSTAYRHKREHQKALEYLDLGLEIIENGAQINYEEIANIYIEKSQIYENIGDQKMTIHFAEAALTLASKDVNTLDETIARAHLVLSDGFEMAREYEKLLISSKKAQSIYKRIYGDSNNSLALVTGQIAFAYSMLGEFEKGMEAFDNALRYSTTYDDSNEQSSILDPNTYLTILRYKIYCLSRYYLTSNDGHILDQAINETKRADSLISIFRTTHSLETDQISFSNKLKGAYDVGLKTYWLAYIQTKEDSYKREMFNFSEKTKSQILKQTNKYGDQLAHSDIPDSLIRQEQLLRADIRRFRSELEQMKFGEKTKDSTAIEKHQTKLLQMNKSHDDLLANLKSEHSNFYNHRLNFEISSLDQIRQSLGDESTLIEYFVGDSLLYTFVVDQDSLFVFEQINPNIEETVQSLHESVSKENYEGYLESGHKLYKKLIAPIEDKIKNDRLVIVPDGALWHVNFDLLLTTDRKVSYKELDYLINKYTISYVYSADMMVLEREREVTKSGNNELLAFSFESSENQDQGESISLRALRESNDDLPGSRKEIKAISTLVDGEYFYGSKADKASFVENAKDYSVLHLAVHGIMNEKYPMNSKLQFTPTDSTDDGALHAYELYNMSLNTDLAVLSACNTGAGKIAKGEGIMSLGRAFTYAGCKSLVLTQWEVPDATTPEVMASFYEDLSNGQPKDVALRQAKLKYLASASEPLSSPLHWGSFVLIGNQDAIALGDKTNFIIFAISGFVIIILAGVFRRKKNIKSD